MKKTWWSFRVYVGDCKFYPVMCGLNHENDKDPYSTTRIQWKVGVCLFFVSQVNKNLCKSYPLEFPHSMFEIL